eukprot:4807474-Ditylum_brightwellii.AAC.1
MIRCTLSSPTSSSGLLESSSEEEDSSDSSPTGISSHLVQEDLRHPWRLSESSSELPISQEF